MLSISSSSFSIISSMFKSDDSFFFISSFSISKDSVSWFSLMLKESLVFDTEDSGFKSPLAFANSTISLFVTLSGLIHDLAKEIPKVGKVFYIEDVKLQIISRSINKINKVKLSI